MKAAFKGDVRNRHCQAQLHAYALPPKATQLTEAAWKLDISCDRFMLLRNDPRHYPLEARAIERWPQIAKFYRNFAPKGTVRLSCQLSKEKGRLAQPRLARATFEILDAHIRYRHFPYSVNDITGAVEINIFQRRASAP